MQGLIYFLGYDKEKVVEPGTQKFFWKSAKSLLTDEFLEKMEKYEFMGPKDGKFTPYQTINYIERIIDGIDPGEVDEYNLLAGRLFKWLKLAIENRKLDIIRRRALIFKEREERDSKIKAKEEREIKRQNDLKEAIEKFAEENKDEIEAYNNYIKKKEGGGDEYAEEEDDEEGEDKNKEPPTLPEFNQ